MPNTPFYITTPIYYVNDKPHIGHAYTTILADVLARYHRLLGDPVHFLTGTDEHGQKVQQAAESGGIPAQDHADRTVVRFQELWERLEITNNDFIRTTEERHKIIVQEILQDLYDRGEIYDAEHEGWYDISSETFVTDKDVDEDNLPDHIVRIKERNYFFRMGSYQEWLIQYIEDNPTFIQPDFRRNETLGFLRQPLQDLCISRPKTRLAWGIELPFDKDFVTYVWFDALVNYISAIGYRRDDAQFATWWPATYQLIGKDILTTHTVYWPTMLKAMGVELPQTIFAHGWWLSGQSKMSKSAGNVVDPMKYIDQYGVDAFRYFLMAEMVLGQDASFTEETFSRRYNTDLANDLGNLLSRVTKLILSHFDGRIPTPAETGAEESKLQEVALALSNGVGDAVQRMRLDDGLAQIAAAFRETNRYLEQRQPWVLAKDPHQKELLGTVLYHGAEVLRIVSGLLYPVMPGKMEELRSVLGLPAGEPDIEKLGHWGVLKPGAEVRKITGLFPRTDSRAQKAGAAEQGKPEKKEIEGVMQAEFADFQKIELKTARIVEAERVPDTDKLLRLQLDVAGESRQIVAGIAAYYEPETLVGRTIVIVANLKPAKIRGVESQGMLLAASTDDSLRLVTVDGEIPTGARVG
ncbi:MAG: methionine--tRNA ligase [Verrucomicrobia bacterium]|nr:methionine--tRNA ligase [Verrucomicrobiota bacterium]MDA1086591.1 methionine--tRNA ligase [Verrucomicrobiota bacterium]